MENNSKEKVSILIVDDSPDARMLLEAILKSAGYKDVYLMSSGRDVLNYFNRDDLGGVDRNVDLILMDVVMPEMDGIEACRRIKAIEYLKDIPIIMVTAQTDTDNLRDAFASGAADYVTKPPNKVELLARVRSSLRLKHEMDRRKAREKELLEVTRQLAAANEALRRVSLLDGLTGIPNRRFFDETIRKEWCRSIRWGAPVSLIISDIDNFKDYNDRYGHLAGDDCLKMIAKALSHSIKRSGDFVARYGGEEFATILPHTKISGGVVVAERMRSNVAALGIEHAASAFSSVVTISLGVAACDLPARGSKPDELLSIADKALYRAKHNGRNRLEVANNSANDIEKTDDYPGKGA